MSNNSQKPRGFAGLEDMASEIDIPDSIHRTPNPVPTQKSDAPQSASSNHRPFEVDESRMKQPKPKETSSPKKWIIGGSIFLALVIIINLINKNPSNNYSAPTIYEEMPTPGSGVVLNDDQIRYCLAQNIRLNSWESAVDKYSRTALDAFNAAVGDYNNRCANYKYRRGALERVRSEVESRRGSLQSEGVSKASTYR
ncbi:MAG: hypothetical protein AB3X44_00255 [Leptothrix sp. (in: b-proteobacteria)]